jgi:tetratricopeptide (TPR) repeat protein
MEKTGNQELLAASKNRLKAWVDCIIGEDVIRQILKKEFQTEFSLFYGKILLDENAVKEASNHYQVALEILPETPDIYIAATDTCFSLQDFDTGLQYLKKAVSLNKHYVVYWKNMGDNLKNQGDMNGAVMAYEQFFLAVPDNLDVLKKMHECYVKIGDIQSAQTILQRIEKLESIGIGRK